MTRTTFTRRLLAYITVASIIVSAIPAHALPARDGGTALRQQGRWIVEAAGRVVIMHGGNVSLPGDGERECIGAAWDPMTPTRMAEQGFNAVRLVIFMSHLMPQPGHINAAYLDCIGRSVGAYRASGIRTLIDFHQDEYGPSVGVRGMPSWAVFTDGHQRQPGLQFPMGYFKDPAVQHAFDNFWANRLVPGTGHGVQDFYAEALTAVARKFRLEPAVIGIDVMNEPATGSLCAEPNPASADCPALEQSLLRPFYVKASRAIARAAPGMLIFVEPFMLQGALGTPIHTPIVAPAGQRGLSYHNYGPVKAIRDRVNDNILSLAISNAAAPLNTEWGFTNDPVEIISQAEDFDSRVISWLAWPRGAFEALVNPALPDNGNGNRSAILRAYARPFPRATAGTPEALSFDDVAGRMTYRYAVRLPCGKRAATKLTTEIAIPRANFPLGYSVEVQGADVISANNASVLRLRNRPRSAQVSVTVRRLGTLPALMRSTSDEPDEALETLPPIPEGPLSRASLLGHIVVTSGGREALDTAMPGLLTGVSQIHGWERMTLMQVQKLAGGALTDAKLSEIDDALAKLPVTPGPVSVQHRAAHLNLDSLTSELLADPNARAILAREAPGLATSPVQGLFPQTTLRNLQPALPDLLTNTVLTNIGQALDNLP
jgi:endoglycosylceramidase